jgi:triacylglycerol lipase
VNRPAPKPLPDPELSLLLLLRPESNPTGHVPFASARLYPFEPDARVWSRANGWWLAEASWLAYWRRVADVRQVYARETGLDCELLEAADTQCHVAADDALAIVAFRGTQSDRWRDLLDDTQFTPLRWEAGHVHRGFGRAFAAIRPQLDTALARLAPSCRVWFTGHSLGGALATLAAYHYRDRAAGLYTFGSPRVGNSVFAGLFGPVFQERSMRYVNDHDLVTHVPPQPFALPHGLYTHIDHLRWINADGQVGSTQPTLPHFVRDVFGRTNVLLDFVQPRTETPLPLPAALADHAPLLYALHCWNDFARHADVPAGAATS